MDIKNSTGWGRCRISKKLEEDGYRIHPNVIHGWLNGRKPTLKEFKINNKLTKEKAFILGVIGPGDGYIRGRRDTIGLNVIDKDFAIKFKSSLEKIYNIECSFKKVKPSGLGNKLIYRVMLYSINVVKDFKKYNVSFKESNWEVPNIIKLSSDEMIASYLTGFFDSQGCVSERRIEAFSKNKQGLREIGFLLESLNLRYSIKNNKISIYSRNSLNKFYNEVGFSIQRKQNKLFYMLKGYKRNYTTSDKADILIPLIKKYLNKGYSQRRVASMLDISRTIIKNRISLFGGIN